MSKVKSMSCLTEPRWVAEALWCRLVNASKGGTVIEEFLAALDRRRREQPVFALHPSASGPLF